MLGAEHIGKDRAGVGGGKYETDKIICLCIHV